MDRRSTRRRFYSPSWGICDVYGNFGYAGISNSHFSRGWSYHRGSCKRGRRHTDSPRTENEKCHQGAMESLECPASSLDQVGLLFPPLFLLTLTVGIPKILLRVTNLINTRTHLVTNGHLDEYHLFYTSFFKDFSKPMAWHHFSGDSDGVSFKGLIFLPAKL